MIEKHPHLLEWICPRGHTRRIETDRDDLEWAEAVALDWAILHESLADWLVR